MSKWYLRQDLEGWRRKMALKRIAKSYFSASNENQAGNAIHLFSAVKKPPIVLGLFLFGQCSIDQRHQRLGIVAAEDEPVPFVVDELNDDDFLISTPE